MAIVNGLRPIRSRNGLTSVMTSSVDELHINPELGVVATPVMRFEPFTVRGLTTPFAVSRDGEVTRSQRLCDCAARAFLVVVLFSVDSLLRGLPGLHIVALAVLALSAPVVVLVGNVVGAIVFLACVCSAVAGLCVPAQLPSVRIRLHAQSSGTASAITAMRVKSRRLRSVLAEHADGLRLTRVRAILVGANSFFHSAFPGYVAITNYTGMAVR